MNPISISKGIFPLPHLTMPWSKGRGFGAKRPNGRAHAGCDLIAKVGTEVFAVADGTVLLSKSFNISYLPNVHVWEILIDHYFFQARYCELKGPAAGIKNGMKVTQGQLIGYVGQLSQSSMLHFELYSGNSKKYPTQRGNSKYLYVPPAKYERKEDLIDPTPYLNQWSQNLLVCK